MIQVQGAEIWHLEAESRGEGMEARGGDFERLEVEKCGVRVEDWDVVVGEEEMFEFVTGFE